MEELGSERSNEGPGESQCHALSLKYMKCEKIQSNDRGAAGEIVVPDESQVITQEAGGDTRRVWGHGVFALKKTLGGIGGGKLDTKEVAIIREEGR